MMRGFEDMTYKEMLIEFVLFNLDIRRLRENMRSLLTQKIVANRTTINCFSWPLNEREE